MGWKPGRSQHDRKFLLAAGSLFDRDAGRDHESVPLGFWGEWEAPSVFWRVESAGRPLPVIVHAPFRPTSRPAGSVQNTDPMVFGDSFVYSNCLQAAFRILRFLSPGSMVLFGRHARTGGRASFGLDTCLVIHRPPTMAPVLADGGWGADLLTDVVLGPLRSEGWAGGDLTVYFGQRRSPVSPDPFSYFPARLMRDSPPLFARPELCPAGALHGVISPEKPQGIKVTANLTITDRDAVWAEVAEQVTRQGCGLGYHVPPPPVLGPNAARSAAQHTPRPLDS